MDAKNLYFKVGLNLKKTGQTLRRTREDGYLSVRELSLLCGMSSTQVARMEAGEEFSASKLVQLCAPLGLSPARLLDWTLKVDINPAARREEAAAETLIHLEKLANWGRAAGHAATPLVMQDLVDVAGTCACQLLFSASPSEALENLHIPYPSLRRRLAGFLEAYGPETEAEVRAATYRAIAQRPAHQLRALGLLACDVVTEFLESRKNGQENVATWLTEEEGEFSEEGMSAANLWTQLLGRISKATEGRGAKARLARDMHVTRQAVSKWLSEASAPSADTVLHLLQWVTAEEARQQQLTQQKS